MKLLLDTHAFIWWDENPSKLGTASRLACSDPNNELMLSTASVWEIQLKRMVGKLTLAKPLQQLLEEQTRQNGLDHRDPFDRILIAQAQVEGWTIVTHDGALKQYGVPVLW